METQISSFGKPPAESADPGHAEITFRDRVATIDDEGRRKWIYPKKPKGRFTRARTLMSWILLAFFFSAPVIQVNGEPLMLLNFPERKFIILSVSFWPQDFYLFGLVMIAAMVFIFLFTAVFGRVFCGWVCPQTIFMEMVFRKIEYLIEGDSGKQRLLALQPWTPSKLAKKTAKHAVFAAMALLVSAALISWVIGVKSFMNLLPGDAAVTAAWAGLAGAVYFVFAWFREQTCTLVCPYGRLQSVLLDDNSVVITYDFERGEPRGRMRKGADRSQLGDCVDCRQCVVVCPTGIDIRNGTQLECVNCTACIDACDGVMDRLGLPRGLVRYASHASIRSGSAKLFTPRVIGYSAVLALLLGLISYLFLARTDVEATVLRVPGTLYEEREGGIIRNLYSVKVINKTSGTLPVEVALAEPAGVLTMVGTRPLLPAGGIAQTAVFIEIPRANLAGPITKIKIDIRSGGRVMQTVRSTFVGPAGSGE